MGRAPQKQAPSSSKATGPTPQDLFIQRAIEATALEIHMGQYPIFCISTGKPEDTRLTVRERIEVGGAEIVKEWAIQVTQHYGWPGEHEAEVWRAIQHIAELRARAGQLINPMRTTLEEIREHMSAKSKGGQQRSAIVRSLSCLGNTKLETNYWYDRERLNYDKAEFSLIAELILKQRKLPDGKLIICGVSIQFADKLFLNLKNRHVRPLDKGMMERLERWLAKRLYELLGPKFYGLRNSGAPYRTRYSRLCGLLGTKRQRYLSRAQQILGRAHVELQGQRFLAKVEWYPIRHDAQDWVVHYWPGERARAEWRKEHWRRIPEMGEPVYIEEPPETEALPAYVEEPAEDESRIEAEVVLEPAPEMLLSEVEVVVEEEPERAKPRGKSSEAGIPRAPEAKPERVRAKAKAPEERASEDPYARMAIEAFERGTGKFRKLPRLTQAERERLKQWQELGVSEQDIESGARAAVQAQTERGWAKGKAAQEILSLAYLNGHVLEALEKRQRLEAMQSKSLKKARALQSREVLEVEAKLQEQMLERLGAELYGMFFGEAVLVEGGKDYLVLLVPNEPLLPLMQKWRGVVEQSVGRTVYFAWAVEWVTGPGWRQQL